MKIKFKSDLKTLLSVSTLVAVFIPLFIVVVTAFFILMNTMRQEIINRNIALANSVAREIGTFLNAPLNELGQLKYDLSKNKSNSYAHIQSSLESILQAHPYFSEIMIIDYSGKVKHRYPYNQDYIGLDTSGQKFYSEAKQYKNTYWSPVSISLTTGYPTTYLSIPFADGIIVGHLNLSILKDISEKFKILENGYSIVTDQTGTIISHKDYRFVSEQLILNYPELLEMSRKAEAAEYDLMGTRYLTSVAVIPTNLWTVLILQPAEKAFAPVNEIITTIALGFIAVILLMTFISLTIAKRFSLPLIRLKDKTKQVASGDYSIPLPTTDLGSYSEVSELSHQFNRMIEAVKNREDALNFAQFSIDNAYEAMFWFDSQGKCLNANISACQLLGYSKEELLSKSICDIDINCSKENFSRNFQALKELGSINFETNCKTSAGRLFPADITYSLLSYNGLEYLFIFMRDISERKSAQEALANEKELLQATLRSIGEGVISTDIAGRIIVMNRMAEKILGYGRESLGMHIDDIFHVFNIKTKVREHLVNLLMQSNGFAGHSSKHIFITKDGIEKILLLALSPVKDRESRVIGTVLAFQDITEQARMEEELLKADKLESLGLLAGGIAHDFNNQLTGILGNIGLARIFLEEDKDKAYSRLVIAEKAIENAQSLTQQLLTFSKGGSPIKVASSIEKVIKDTVEFSLRGSSVRCEFSIAEGILPVEIDEGQMSRVINNLIINACHAMPDGGLINISIDNAAIDENSSLPLKPGKYVLITIKDHGAGIPEENLSKIFDPYFSTKKKGSGLGLTVAYSIVNKHSGHLSVKSKVNEGTTFYVYLPALIEEVSLTASEDNNKIVLGKGKILVMDDEEDIRLIANELLGHLGYSAELSKDGEEAFELYKKAEEAGEPFDAVIMDLTVPGGLGGRELMALLLRYDPKVKAIVSSGYSNDLIMAFYSDFGFSAFILKPFKVEEFSQVLHKVLNSSERV
jgi:PAS domain S-box-containing protein